MSRINIDTLCWMSTLLAAKYKTDGCVALAESRVSRFEHIVGGPHSSTNTLVPSTDLTLWCFLVMAVLLYNVPRLLWICFPSEPLCQSTGSVSSRVIPVSLLPASVGQHEVPQ